MRGAGFSGLSRFDLRCCYNSGVGAWRGKLMIGQHETGDAFLLTLLRRQDERVFAFVTSRRMRMLDGVMRAATHAADAPVAIAFAAGLALGAVPTFQSAGLIALFTLVL